MTDIERKRAEAAFHDHREQDRRAMGDEEWQAKYSNKRWYAVADRHLQFVDAQIASGGPVVLDYCCGLGGNSRRIAALDKRVIGVDISLESVQTSRDTAVSGSFCQMDAERLGLRAASIDNVLCAGVLHHLDVNVAFPEIARVLRPGGRVVAVEALGYNPIIQLYRRLTPHLRTAWEADHILTHRDLRVARRSFETVQVRYFYLFEILAVPFRRFDRTFRLMRRVLGLVDRYVLLIPGVRRLAWQMVFVLEDPKK